MRDCTKVRSGARSMCLVLAAIVATTVAAGAAFAGAPARSLFTFPWDWHIKVRPNIGSPTDPNFGEPIEIWLWGTATMAMDAPELTDGTGPPTFDLGPGGVGPNTPSAEAPPEGGVYSIPIEIVAMDLHSMMPVEFPGGTTDVILRSNQDRPIIGEIFNLRNLGDGTVAADSFFDIFVDIELPQLGMLLRTDEPMRAGMSFTPDENNALFPPAPPVGELDIPWIPTWIWREILVNENAPRWLDTTGLPWDEWVEVHGHVTVPEPGALALVPIVGVLAWLRRRRRA